MTWCLEERIWRDLCVPKNNVHTEKYFRNLIKSNWNQIVFTIFQLICNQTTSVWLQANGKMVNTIWFQFDLIRFRKDLSYLSVNKARNSCSVKEILCRKQRIPTLHQYARILMPYRCWICLDNIARYPNQNSLGKVLI